MKTYLLFGTIFTILLSGCGTTHLEKFYVDVHHESKVPKSLKKVQPDIFGSNDVANDAQKAIGGGMTLLGHSDYWTSQPPTVQDLRRHAQRVGATTVIYSVRHRGSETQMRPVYNWVPGTTATYDSSGQSTAQTTANFYGTGWSGSGYGTAQSSYSTTATASTPGRLEFAGAVPVQVHFYDVGAAFLRRPTQEYPRGIIDSGIPETP